MISILVQLGLLIPLAVLGQAERSVSLDLGTRTLEVGEQVDARLVCLNVEPSSVPEMEIPTGLEISMLSQVPTKSSSVTIFNGVRTERTTYTFPLRIVATKAGEYTIGPIRITSGAQEYKTDPVTMTVRQPDNDSRADGDRLIYVHVDAQPREVFVTQEVVATLRLGIRAVEHRGTHLNIDLFRSVLDSQSSQFSIFPGERPTIQKRWLTDSDGNRHLYEELKIEKTIRADEIGPMKIGPVFVKADYPTSVRRSMFGEYQATQTRKETDRADAITVNVKAPPLEGRPFDFSGAIGRYTLHASATPVRVEKGQPITLTLRLRGQPLEGVAGPDLTVQPGLASRFDFSNEEFLGELEGNMKVFRRAIFPRQEGNQTIPPITWSYFDVHSAEYRTLSTDPIEVVVDPPSTTTQQMTVFGDDPDDARKSQSLTVIRGGLSPNYVDVEKLLADQRFSLTPPWIALIVGSPVLWLGFTLVARYKRRLQTDAGFARRKGAARRAMSRVREAEQQASQPDRAAMLGEALTEFVADRFNLSGGHRTPAEIEILLEQHGASRELVTQVSEFLSTCEHARYASALGDGMLPADAGQRIQRWIKSIEATTR